MSPRVKIELKREIIQMLVDDLNSGKYFLPSFQRQYVWDEDDIKDLIDSIIKNYPIGTIILWKPSTVSISEIDPFSRPLVDVGKSDHREVFYVIDGQQRLTSLLLLFNNWEIERGGEKITCGAISYNPSNKRFYKSTKRGVDLSKLIKAFYQYDDTIISELKRATSEENYKEMENMIKGILNKYPVPICVMETDREDEKAFRDMAEAFIRVNKYGIRIGNLELMLSFLAGAVGGDLKERIRSLYEDLYIKFEIDLQPVIRFAFSNFGLKQTQISKVEQFKRNISAIKEYDSNTTTEIFNKCHKAMNLTITLLIEKLGLSNSRFLPSQTPTVPIAKYLYKKGIDSLDDLEDRDVKNIVNWFVLTSFHGYYSSQTDTKLDKDLEIIQGTYFPWEKLIENMKDKKARTKITLNDIKAGLNLNVLRLQGRAHLFMLYILLIRSQADDWNGVLLSQRNFTELAKHHIFPKEFLEENLELEEPDAKEILINNLANITFIHKDINSEIEGHPPEGYIEDYINSARKHFIPTDKNLWSIDQYTTFLEYRIRQIHTSGKKFFGDIFE
jgi:hypothetical protein